MVYFSAEQILHKLFVILTKNEIKHIHAEAYNGAHTVCITYLDVDPYYSNIYAMGFQRLA